LNRRDFLKRAGITAAAASGFQIVSALARPAIRLNISPYETTTTSNTLDSLNYVQPAALKVPYTDSPPDVSTGVIKPEQWKTATIVKIIPNGTEQFIENALAYLMMLHSESGLYAGANFPSQESVGNGHLLGFFFDTAHNGFPWTPQKDDVDLSARIVSVIRNATLNVTLLPMSITGTPTDKVIMKAAIDHSPNISCTQNDNSYASLKSCHLTDGLTPDTNLMYTFFIPYELIKSANPDYPNTVGFSFSAEMTARSGFAYPRGIYSKYNTADKMYPLTDLTLLPQETKTVTSQSSTNTLELGTTTRTQTTTQQSTASSAAPIITRRDFLGLTATQEIEAALLGLVGVGAGSGIAYKLLRKQKSKD
jgi:hypothetical protein